MSLPRHETTGLLALDEGLLQQVLTAVDAEHHSIRAAVSSCRHLLRVGRARDLTLRLEAYAGENLLNVPDEDTFRGCTQLLYTGRVPTVQPVACALLHASWYFQRLRVVKLQLCHASAVTYEPEGDMTPCLAPLAHLPSLRSLEVELHQMLPLVALGRLTQLTHLDLTLTNQPGPHSRRLPCHLTALARLTGLQHLQLDSHAPPLPRFLPGQQQVALQLGAGQQQQQQEEGEGVGGVPLPVQQQQQEEEEGGEGLGGVPLPQQQQQQQQVELDAVGVIGQLHIQEWVQHHREQLRHPCLPPGLTHLELRRKALEAHWLPHVCGCSALRTLALRQLEYNNQGYWWEPHPAALLHGVLPHLPQLQLLELDWSPGDTLYWSNDQDPAPFVDAPTVTHIPQGPFPTTAWAAAPQLQVVRCTPQGPGLVIPEAWHWRQLAACPGLLELSGNIICLQPPPQGLTLDHLTQLEVQVVLSNMLHLGQVLPALPALQKLMLTVAAAQGVALLSADVPPEEARTQLPCPVLRQAFVNLGNLQNFQALGCWRLIGRQVAKLQALHLCWPVDRSNYMPELTACADTLTYLNLTFAWVYWTPNDPLVMQEDVLHCLQPLQALTDCTLHDLRIGPSLSLALQHMLPSLRSLHFTGSYDARLLSSWKFAALVRPGLDVALHTPQVRQVAGAPAYFVGPVQEEPQDLHEWEEEEEEEEEGQEEEEEGLGQFEDAVSDEGVESLSSHSSLDMEEGAASSSASDGDSSSASDGDSSSASDGDSSSASDGDSSSASDGDSQGDQATSSGDDPAGAGPQGGQAAAQQALDGAGSPAASGLTHGSSSSSSRGASTSSLGGTSTDQDDSGAGEDSSSEGTSSSKGTSSGSGSSRGGHASSSDGTSGEGSSGDTSSSEEGSGMDEDAIPTRPLPPTAAVEPQPPAPPAGSSSSEGEGDSSTSGSSEDEEEDGGSSSSSSSSNDEEEGSSSCNTSSSGSGDEDGESSSCGSREDEGGSAPGRYVRACPKPGLKQKPQGRRP